MVYVINEELAQELKKLDGCEDQVLDKLCATSYDLLKRGESGDWLTDNDEWRPLVTSLMKLIVQSIKFGSSESDLNDQLSTVQCPSTLQSRLVEQYRQHRSSLATLLRSRALEGHERFVRLTWRFEVQVSSRWAREQFEPRILLRFHTVSPANQARHFDVHCTVPDLYHILNKVSEALAKNNSAHSTKLLRHIK